MRCPFRARAKQFSAGWTQSGQGQRTPKWVLVLSKHGGGSGEAMSRTQPLEEPPPISFSLFLLVFA